LGTHDGRRVEGLVRRIELNLLLDTCTFLWLSVEPEKLSSRAKEVIESSNSHVYLSTVSVWEIVVKHMQGRLPMPEDPAVLVPKLREQQAIESLRLSEAAALAGLKLPRLHGDPFDRMLICQAITDQLVIVTPDPQIRQYPIRVEW